MFRVPVDADLPTFDRTEKITLRRWLKSSKVDRVEWQRRGRLATATAAADKIQREGPDAAGRQAARELATDMNLRQAEGQAALGNHMNHPQAGGF